MMTRAVVVAVAVLLATGSVAGAAVHSEDWNTDPGVGLGGWTGDSIAWMANGGPDDSGHLWATRPELTYPPYMETANDPVQSATGDDVNATYGEWVNISLDVKMEDENPPDEIGYGWWIYDADDAIWHTNLEYPGGTPTTWTNYSVTFSTTWTDLEANAGGFFSFGSAKSWAELMTNVSKWNFAARAMDFKNGGAYTCHLDNFQMETTTEPEPPEPGTKTYTEDWNTDPGVDLGGWDGDGLEWVADGGPDGSGHLKGYRPTNYPPYMRTTYDPVQAEVGDDFYMQYGKDVRITLDAMIEDDAPPDEIGYGWWIYDKSGGVWYKALETAGSAPSEWTTYTEEIDTTWSDEDANVAGWFNSDSVLSWSVLMRNLGEWNFMGRDIANVGGGAYTGHLDNLVIESIGGETLPGDLDGDGFVGGADLDIVRSFWGQTVIAGNKLHGDPSGDGFVGGDDLDEVRAHWGEGTPPAPTDVPEPSTLVTLLSMALAALVSTWRRK